MTALAEALADSGRGVLEVIPSGSIGTGEDKLDEYANAVAEAQFFARISRRKGVPVTFSTAQVPSAELVARRPKLLDQGLALSSFRRSPRAA
jgi:hypothetical protein